MPSCSASNNISALESCLSGTGLLAALTALSVHAFETASNIPRVVLFK
jgi:hypothetical protein